MTNRQIINTKIADWIVNRVKTKYANDVSMVLIYGSFINGTANNKSDLDCYYIPKTEYGYNMALSFIIDSVGYDIFPMSWERIKKIADLQDTLLSCVNDVKIIYYNSDEDLKRFKKLQERLKQNLLDNNYSKSIALNKFQKSCEIYSTMCNSYKSSDIRKYAGNIIITLADAIAIYNHNYYHLGLKKQFEDLKNKFLTTQDIIVNDYKNVIKSANDKEYLENSLKILEDVSKYLNCELLFKPSKQYTITQKTDYIYLARLYEEIISTFNKIYICCKSDNYILAFLSAVCLQSDLDEAFEFGCPVYDLLSHYNYNNLGMFAKVTKNVENDFTKFILNGGGNIKKYNDFEEFKKHNL